MRVRLGKPHPYRTAPARGMGRLWFPAAAGFVVLCCAGVGARGQVAARRPAPRNVLVLYSDERLLPANIRIDQAINAVFAAEKTLDVDLHSEFLDAMRFPDETERKREWTFFHRKYRKHPVDLVIAVGWQALDLTMERRAELFPGVPVVYCSCSGEPHPQLPPNARIADVPVPYTAVATLEMMLRFHPGTRSVAVITGCSPADEKYANAFRQGVAASGIQVPITWLTDITLEQLRDRLSRLPDGTLVFGLTLFQDASGRTFIPIEAFQEVAPACRVPIYSHFDTALGLGIVGGIMVTFDDIGRKAAEVGVRILNGADPQTIARSESYQPVARFDWRQLRRWGISEARLPPGSIVRYRTPTLWEQYRGYVVAALTVLLLQTLLIAALVRQLRQRRRAEASLRESEQRMSLALDAAELGLWVRDLTRDRYWASDRWRELYGFGQSEPIDLAGVLRRVHPDDRGALQQALAEGVAVGGRYENEFRLLLPDGETRWISSQSRVEHDAAGRPVRTRGAARDVTARKREEQETQQLREQVAHVDRVSVLGQLSSALAHEISQPLSAILRNAQAGDLFMRHPSPDLDEIRAIVSDIRKDVQRASEIIERMRGLLRRQDMNLVRLDLRDIVEDVGAIVRADAEAREVKLDVDVPRDLPCVLGDRVHLQQVLLNLIINGMDAAGEAGRPHRRVSVTSRNGAQSVEVAVSDTGRGIPPDALARVFEFFYTTKANGLGMGLPISRTIIEAHGGRLWAENNDDGGATFRFTLPVAEEQAPSGERRQEARSDRR